MHKIRFLQALSAFALVVSTAVPACLAQGFDSAAANAWAGLGSEGGGGGGEQFKSGGTGDQGSMNQATGEGVNGFGPNASGNGRTIPGLQQQQWSQGSASGQSGTQQIVDNPWAQPNSISNQILRPGGYSSPNSQGTVQMIPTWAPSFATAQGGYNMGGVPSGQFSFGFTGGGMSAAGARWSQGFGGLPATSTSSCDFNIVDQ